MKLLETSVPDNLVAVNLSNVELARMNLIIGDNGTGKTRALDKIHSSVRERHGEIDVFTVGGQSFCSSDIKNLNNMKNTGLLSGFSKDIGQATSLLRSVEPSFEKLVETDDEHGIMVKLEGRKELVSINDMSAGFKKLLEISLKAINLVEGFLLIDDVDFGLHYTKHEALIKLILDTAKTNENQVFMTTHNNEFIQSFSDVTFADNDTDALLIRMGYSARKSDLGENIATAFDKSVLEGLLRGQVRL